MKVFRTSIIFLAFLFTSHLKSQNCSEAYYVSKVGTKLTYETKDEKGKLITTQESTVKAIKNTTDGTEIGLSATSKDGKGKAIMENMDFTVVCSNGIIKLRFSDMMMASMSRMKDMEMEMAGDGIHYPSDLKEGQELPNGETEIKIKTSGMTLMTIRQKEISHPTARSPSVRTPQTARTAWAGSSARCAGPGPRDSAAHFARAESPAAARSARSPDAGHRPRRVLRQNA